ncbi:MAG TPA: hypothetical protein VKT29_01520, partial [Terriglobales bacterium]|nr:hypothetical protein [Terriglobales bacterium]
MFVNLRDRIVAVTGKNKRKQALGFTLIASLLLLVLLSGVAIGLMMMVNTEGKVGGHDVQNSLAYRSAEGAIEKMTSDLANKFQSIQAPTASDITSLDTLAPTNDPNVTYPVYTLSPATNPDGSIQSSYGQIRTGPYQGLYAQIVPITLSVTAQRPLGDEVSMTRTVEEALIPVFQ